MGAAYKSGKDLVLVSTGGAAHAELKLLSLLATACITGAFPESDRIVAVAGLKIACKGCMPWMTRFYGWINSQYKVRLTFEVKGRLGNPHTAAGKRPANAEADELGPYIRALFNQEKTNDSFVDVDEEVDPEYRTPKYS